MIQTTFDTKDFNAANTSTGTAGNTTSCQGLVDVAGSVGQISSNKLKLNGTNYQTAPVRHATTKQNGGVRGKITVGSGLSAVLQCRGQSNNAGFWAFVNSTLLMTTATAGGTAGSFPAGKKTLSNTDYLLELSAQQTDSTHCTVTAKILDAATSAVLDMCAFNDGTAALQASSSLGVSGGLLNPCFIDDMVFFTLPEPFTQTLNIVSTGDSLTAGSGSSAGHDYPTVMGQLLGSRATVTNNGVSGNTIADLTTRAAATDALLSATPGVVNILHVRVGTNDMLASPGHNHTTVYNDLKTYCQARRSAGWTIIFVWLIQVRSEAGLSANWTTNAPLLNADLLASAVSDGFCNAVVQFDARFTPGSSESAATTWFNGDHIHNNDDGYLQAAIYASEATRDNLPPVTPLDFAATPDPASTNLQWDDEPAATSFSLYRGLASDHSDEALINSPAAGSSSYADTGTTSGVHYYYRIKANNAAGSSGLAVADAVAQGPLSPPTTRRRRTGHLQHIQHIQHLPHIF